MRYSLSKLLLGALLACLPRTGVAAAKAARIDYNQIIDWTLGPQQLTLPQPVPGPAQPARQRRLVTVSPTSGALSLSGQPSLLPSLPLQPTSLLPLPGGVLIAAGRDLFLLDQDARQAPDVESSGRLGKLKGLLLLAFAKADPGRVLAAVVLGDDSRQIWELRLGRAAGALRPHLSAAGPAPDLPTTQAVFFDKFRVPRCKVGNEQCLLRKQNGHMLDLQARRGAAGDDQEFFTLRDGGLRDAAWSLDGGRVYLLLDP